MIVSHEHRFIFLKTRKTAGTSVEIALSGICGPDDIITPITPADEVLRADRRGPQNFESPPLVREATNHSPARKAREIVGEDVWRDYTKFTVERNPWDQVVSSYYWAARTMADPPSFEVFVRRPRVAKLAETNARIYRIGGRLVADIERAPQAGRGLGGFIPAAGRDGAEAELVLTRRDALQAGKFAADRLQHGTILGARAIGPYPESLSRFRGQKRAGHLAGLEEGKLLRDIHAEAFICDVDLQIGAVLARLEGSRDAHGERDAGEVERRRVQHRLGGLRLFGGRFDGRGQLGLKRLAFFHRGGGRAGSEAGGRRKDQITHGTGLTPVEEPSAF